MKNNAIKITEIPINCQYEGYLWWSNAQIPKVFKNEPLPEWPGEKANPFIIEGQLYDLEGQKSYSIRFVDGEYFIQYIDLKELNGLESIKKEYLTNRMDGVQKLCFKEFWRPVEDKLCEGMEVLQPAEVVFVGFKK